ncbi:MAG: phage holin family protein [Oscillospiraceae bacterium]|nr:phage holin family protein [Oscillospiraceae bacterium]
MKYIIMMTIVLCLAGMDFLTGIIKAYVSNDLCSQKMRKGGLNKIAELVVMATACGLEIGMDMLGRYYHTAELAGVAGTVAAGAVFTYIVLMELISILENYGEISPDAVWVRRIIKKLRNFKDQEDEKHDSEKNDSAD